MANITALARSPLTGQTPYQGTQTQIAEHPFLGKLALRGSPENAAFMKAVSSVLGTDLPVKPNTVVDSERVQIVWVGPDEWQITAAEGAQTPLQERLQAALQGIHSAVVDVSDYYTTIRISGVRARDVLAKGCSLDLHPRVFGPGQCAGSLFLKATVRIVQVDDTPTYDLQVRWTFAEYLFEHLVRGAEEWG